MPKRFIVIIAGGKGERFWPQSRTETPKHLLPIVGSTAMLEQTIDRVIGVVPVENIIVITSAQQEKGVRAVCHKLPAANVVAEPVGRDTAPAVGLAAALVEQQDPEGVFAVLPADHVIHDSAAYQLDLEAAFAAAEADKVMVTIGIRPDQPATGFGYIQSGAKWQSFGDKEFYRVARFVEKPDAATAESYLASGDYFWNAGMFVWSVPVVLEAMGNFAPELLAGFAPIREGLAAGRELGPLLAELYPTLVKVSVDYALLEKSTNVVVHPAQFDWDDVGAWPAVANHYPKDEAGNVMRGLAMVEQGSGNIVFSEGGHLVAVVGADDLIVVHTPDATLVCPKSKAQEIKALVKRLAKDPANAALL